MVEVFYFFNPCWMCPFTEPRSVGPDELPSQQSELCCMDSSLSSILVALISQDHFDPFLFFTPNLSLGSLCQLALLYVTTILLIIP